MRDLRNGDLSAGHAGGPGRTGAWVLHSVLSRAIARDLFDGDVLAQAVSFVIVAMAAAPGFSPIVGSAIVNVAGWPALFVAVAFFAVGLGAHYVGAIGETLPPDRREGRSPMGVAAAYGRLLVDPRFICPALAVGLILRALYTFFATAPAILISGMGLTAFQMSVFFAATVFIVFAA
jgi:DHA1 family bicyclomycin/chloramphenicol resistance-like MFS transporter